jgi:phospholipid/cholesterol/gamma-HCH transport system substrate-binding protein
MAALPTPTRRRRRRDTEPVSRALAKTAATLAVLGLVIYVGLSSYNGVPGRSYSTLRVSVPGVGNLIKHDPVRIAGVRVGQVQNLGVGRDERPIVTLQLEPGVRVPVDSQVMVRANGLLGARYVQLVPGRSGSDLRSGAKLTAAADALSFGVPDTLDTLDAATRSSLGASLNALGVGLLGHGADLNTGLRMVAGAAPRFTGLADAIIARPGSAERLVPSLDALVTALDSSRQNLIAMLDPATRALSPFVDQRAAFRDTLDVAPSTLGTATVGLGDARRLLTAADALASSAVTTLPPVPHALTETAALLDRSRGSLAKATSLLHAASPAVPAILRITGPLSPLLAPLRSLFDTALPAVRYVGQRGCDIENFGVVMRSMTGFGGVGTGPIGPAMEFRAQVVLTPEALAPAALVSPPIKDAYAPPCTYLSKAYPYESAGGGR